MISSFFFNRHLHHCDLHSFPTRRSSDLSSTPSSLASARDSATMPISGTPGCGCLVPWKNRRTLSCFSLRREARRSEEHTSELQSRFDIVCRLLLEKKKCTTRNQRPSENL